VYAPALTHPAEGRQTCKVCGRPDRFDFHVAEGVWARIVPAPYRQLVVCLSCFDLFACAVGQTYTLDGPLYFVGDAATLVFEVSGA
jgi:hypothetical protein